MISSSKNVPSPPQRESIDDRLANQSAAPEESGYEKDSPADDMTPAELNKLLGNPLDLDSENPVKAHAEPFTGTVAQKVTMSIAVFLPLIGTAVAIAWMWQYGWMGWMYLVLMMGGWYLTGMGITIGFHRLLTHRSFECHPAVRWFWTAAGACAIEGSPLLWCAIHRRHHQLSDEEGDPHSPHLHDGSIKGILKGFYHAHTGWLFREYWEPPRYKRYVPDLLNDKICMHVDKWYLVYVVASFVAPAAIAGLVTMSWSGLWLGLLWGGFARMLFTQHITWSINSFCHIFGKRDYESGDQSTNNVLFGFVGHGEGWHNNHHAFPTSARHGLKWWQFDASWVVIRGLEMCGLVWSVKTPSPRAMENKRLDKKREDIKVVPKSKHDQVRKNEKQLEKDRVG